MVLFVHTRYRGRGCYGPISEKYKGFCEGSGGVGRDLCMRGVRACKAEGLQYFKCQEQGFPLSLVEGSTPHFDMKNDKSFTS